jgi:peptidoglycan/xylan/chitin deacetylase (PgdA/CDA1 family)/glycosyltransferase involved in cell wall biosynthesis
MIKLSVIIPTFNRRHVLERTLPALEAQDLPPEEYEVIVVIDGSTDDTTKLLHNWKPRCAFRALEAPHRGPGAARNIGIRAAAGELVLLLDDDLIATPDLLRQHCLSHSAFHPSVVNGPIIITADSAESIIRYVTDRSHREYLDHLDPAMEVRYPEGTPATGVLSSMANSSMPREILLRCGGFDEEILAAEDLDLGLRLWKMGVSFRCQPAAISYEYYVKSSWEHLRGRAKDAGAGDLRISRKHPEYRPHSRLAAFAQTRAPNKWLRSLLMRLPVSPVPLLALPLGLEKWFHRLPPFRYAGEKLLGVAEAVARLRSALSVVGSWKSLESEFGRKCPSLLYHHVGPFRPGTYRSLTVSPEHFEQQIRWLARRGYVGITPSDWLRWRREGKGLPEKPILITFDDGYADTAEYAFPILRKYGFVATMFVVTGQFGGTNTWDEDRGSGTLHLMSAEQICRWAAQGIEFGAHSRTHPELTKLSPAECLAEIAGSKSDLAALLGSAAVSFAYPYGDQNEAVCDLVRGEFDIAFSIQEGINYLRTDPHLLLRAYVGPDDSLAAFAFNLRRGGVKKIRDLRIKLGLRTRLRRAFRRLMQGPLQ